MRVNFELKGEMPLLMHWDNIDGSDLMKEWRQDPGNKNLSVAGDDRSPGWTWHTYCYTDGVNVTMPMDNIMAALLYGGSQIILKKQKTFKELSQSGIIPTAEHFEFRYGPDDKLLPIAALDKMKDDVFKVQAEKCKKLGFRLFVKRARVGQSKHVRVRPRFDQWSVRGQVEVTVQEITLDILTQIFDYAGRGGLCDWRPSTKGRPGPYGMFQSKLSKAK
jgi:hypothetical protein